MAIDFGGGCIDPDESVSETEEETDRSHKKSVHKVKHFFILANIFCEQHLYLKLFFKTNDFEIVAFL